MYSRRIVVIAAVALVLATGLAGATGQGDQAASSKKAEILWWHKEGPAVQEWATKVADSFMKENPNVVVKVEAQTGSWGDFGSKLRLALRSATGPDIFSTHDIDQQPFVSAGFTLAAPAYIQKMIDEDSIDPTYIAMAHKNGAAKEPVHIVPWFTHWQQIFYNKKFMAEAGIPMVAAKDWDTFRTYAKKLTKYDAAGKITRAGWTFRIQDPAWAYAAWLYSAGGTWLDDQNKAAGVTMPDNRKAWETSLKYLYDITWTDRAGDFQAGDPQALFFNGQTALAAEGIYYIASIAANAPEMDYFVGNIPKGKYSSAVLAMRPISVSKDCKSPDAAWRLISFALKAENLSQLFSPKSFSLLPPYKSVFKQEKFQSVDAWKVATQQKNIRARMQGLGASDAYNTAGRAVEAYLSKSASLDDALKSVETGVAKIIADRETHELKVPFVE